MNVWQHELQEQPGNRALSWTCTCLLEETHRPCSQAACNMSVPCTRARFTSSPTLQLGLSAMIHVLERYNQHHRGRQQAGGPQRAQEAREHDIDGSMAAQS